MDRIASLLTSIRNAEMARHASLIVPPSKQSLAVLEVLKRNKYVANFESQEKGIQIQLTQPTQVHHFRRISKPGRRMYTSAKDIPTVMSGRGMVVVSTPEGVLSGQEARKRILGGEILCEVY